MSQNGAVNIDYRQKIHEIGRILEKMEKGILDSEIVASSPELTSKMQERDKLVYRLNILKRAGEAGKNGPPVKQTTKCTESATNYLNIEDFGDSIIERLKSVFQKALDKVYPNLALKAQVKEATNPKFGDYQFEMCMQISRRLPNEERESAPEVAKKISQALEKIELVEKYDAANAYINIFLNKEHLGKRLSGIFAKGLCIPKLAKKHVVVDYSSPNIAKQMHVGHLRSTIIGESISRLLEYTGFSVLRLNHIGDWGTQFGMLIAYLQERFPNYLVETPPIQDLQAFYKESKIKFDEDSDFKARAYQCVVQLQNSEPEIVSAWRMICDVSRRDFNEIYKRLDIQLVERGESFYQSRMEAMVQQLERDGVLREEEGRKLFFPSGCNIPLTVVKSDGGFTYDTSDLTALRQRLDEEKADWVLYVVDRGQSEHLETVYAAARQLGWYDAREKRVEHVQIGLVQGEDKKKFKTRAGDTVKLMDLLDEGVARAEEKLRSKGRAEDFSPEEFKNVSEALAYGCIKYSDLAQTRTNDYVFSFDRMLDDRGNTAVYLLYMYARIRSIARNAQVSRENIQQYINGLGNGGVLPMDHLREIRLAKQILKFSDCLLTVVESLQLNKICDYIYELATVFSDFYKDCYVVTKQGADGSPTVNFNRMVLCEVTADVMQNCFNILGIHPTDRM